MKHKGSCHCGAIEIELETYRLPKDQVVGALSMLVLPQAQRPNVLGPKGAGGSDRSNARACPIVHVRSHDITADRVPPMRRIRGYAPVRN
jgi:hypothetical protein